MSFYFYGYFIQQGALKEYFQRNRTLFTSYELPASYNYGVYVQTCALMAGSFGPNYVLYAAITIGTIVLVIVFKRSMQTRRSLTAKQDDKLMSKKEVRLIQSVVAVCVIYIVSCTPLNVFDTVVRLNLISWTGPFFALLAYFARSFNHAMNIFAYLSINSNFRAHFRSLVCFCCTNRNCRS